MMMDPNAILGLATGGLFGAALVVSGLADPDKIIGTLRFKDFHAMRVIAVFVIVAMAGVWILELGEAAHLSIKPAAVVSMLIGGALLGVGFGITGFCPGTGLAAAASGRLDAVVAVAGMLIGALAYILVYPTIASPMDEMVNYGKVTIDEVTGISKATITFTIVIMVAFILFLTRPKSISA